MMTSKERVLRAIRHEEPDIVPTGEWEFGKEIIAPVLGEDSLYCPTLTQIQAYWDGRRDDVVNAWKTGLVEMTHRMKWDAVLVHLAIDHDTPIEVPEYLGDDHWRDAAGNTLCYTRELDKMCIIEKGQGTAAPPPPSPAPASMEPTASELEVVRHVVGELGKTHFIFSAPLYGHPQYRFEDATSGGQVEDWIRLYEDPEGITERRLKYYRGENFRKGVEIAKREGVDGVAGGWDFGTNSGPFMSPEMFKKYVQPVLAAEAEGVHAAGLVFLHHACGNNQVLMDMIVEAGVDVYQSIQPEMDIVAMKKRYGKNIALWGGVDSGKLITADPATIFQDSRHFLAECMPGGGYVFATSHSVMPAAKYENYMAMLDARERYGRYPAKN